MLISGRSHFGIGALVRTSDGDGDDDDDEGSLGSSFWESPNRSTSLDRTTPVLFVVGCAFMLKFLVTLVYLNC